MSKKGSKPTLPPVEPLELNFQLCRKHGIKFPKDAGCPACRAEDRRKIETDSRVEAPAGGGEPDAARD